MISSPVQKRNGAVISIDVDNLLISSFREALDPEDYDLKAGFRKIVRWVRTYAEIFCMHLYIPASQEVRNGSLWDELWEEFSREFMFELVHCPKKRRAKRGEKKDNVDNHLMAHTEKIIDFLISGTKYFVLGAGDIDYSPFLWKLKREKEIEIAFVIGSSESWNRSYRQMNVAGRHPETEEELVHMFSPKKE